MADNPTPQQLDPVTSITDTQNLLVGAGSVLNRITYANFKTLLTTLFAATFQPLAAGLTSLAGLATAADKMAYTTAEDVWAETDVTAFGRSRLADANAAAAISALGAATTTYTNAGDAAVLTLAAKLGTANVFTKTQTWLQGADVASAASLTLGDGNLFDVTGTTAITSIATKGVGTVVVLQFDDILTFTHHATNLILPGGTNITTAAGTILVLYEYATGQWRLVSTNVASAGSSSGLPRGHISGLKLSNNVTDAVNDVDIAEGKARNSADDGDLALASAITKRLDASWVAGTGNGGLSSSLTIADTTYHVHLILVSGVVGVGFDTSVTAANLIADHSATKYRRIGSIIRSGNQIRFFTQRGDHVVSHDAAYTAFTTTTAGQTLTLPVPVGISVRAKLTVKADFAAIDTGVLLSDLSVPSVAPSASAAPGFTASYEVNRTWESGVEIDTNTSGQIRERSTTASRSCATIVRGWIDRRGQDD